ncbi:hypothetical protein DFQ12_0331 [Sphingobacterium detergens]|uniref:Uncharacterized protein n=2 Tax=Sphingobacterium detergens TaxID=1145106 RepID=A0A420BFM2_SPHD1|nr:hypothetical protein DFQ12_0331 [Sphingobacterium detergens]
MILRKIIHSKSKGHYGIPMNYQEALALFYTLNWDDENTFYNQKFGDSYLQLKPLDRTEVADNKEIKVEILIDEYLIKFAVTAVMMSEATALIKYYFEHDKIGNIDSYGVGYP